jgi:hypothetical protein
MKKSTPEIIDLTSEEADRLLERINISNLTDNDKKMVSGIINFCFWLQEKLISAKISIQKLRKIFGAQSEKRPKAIGVSNPADTSELSLIALPPSENIPSKEPESVRVKPNIKKHSKNQGRLGFDSYTGAQQVHIAHPNLSHGSPCPLELCTGRVYKVQPGKVIRIVGGKMADAYQYVLEKLRCNLCGFLYTAPLPPNIGPVKYDARFKATLCVHKYYLGLPFYRMERMQSYLGVPLPDSTQWQLIEQMANSVYRVFYYIEYLAAQGKAVFIDDTGSKILSVILAVKANPHLKRKGSFTSGIISHVAGHKIYLFYSGIRHAGENATELLKKRQEGLSKVLYMCDALPYNIPKDLEIILLNCLSHARRGFIEAEPYYPEQCQFVLNSLSAIYKNDRICKEQNFSESQRLEYHQEKSKPIMDSLKAWAETQLNDNLVEPNNGLGKALNYMLKRWDNFTRFYTVAGAALGRVKQWRGNKSRWSPSIVPFPLPATSNRTCAINASGFRTKHHAFAFGTSAMTRAIL